MSQVPIQKTFIHNQSLPAAENNWLSTDITPTNVPTLFRIMVGTSITGIFKIAITNGGDTQVLNFKESVSLVADSLYNFEILVHSGDTINFRFSTTGGTIRVLDVQEIYSAVA